MKLLRRVVVPLVAVLVGLLPGVVAVEQASALTKLTHSQATSIFRAAGLTWSSSGGCSDWNNPTCTSFTMAVLDGEAQ